MEYCTGKIKPIAHGTISALFVAIVVAFVSYAGDFDIYQNNKLLFILGSILFFGNLYYMFSKKIKHELDYESFPKDYEIRVKMEKNGKHVIETYIGICKHCEKPILKKDAKHCL